ncbi:MAG: tripartite tricarboxylate transporter substrate-binding protein [Rhodobacter sp.]|nr:tripartite tricarboxylate transporter substrate-binding protein [Rhodobacter sp.]
MRTLISASIAAFATLLGSTAAMATDWTPPGPIKLAIAFAAGGGADTQARLIAEELETRHGWTIVPEQITGKGGMNLALAIKDEPNDGSVIGMVVTETLGYNMRAAEAGVTPADFTPIVTTAGFQMGIVSQASKGWNTFHDVIAAAKDGERIRFGVMSPKLADIAYLLGKRNGVDLNIIQVAGGRAVMNGVNAGDMDLGFMAGIQSKGVAAGDLVNLASALSTPLGQTPDAPLLSDLGVEFSADGYFVFIGPAGMPTEAGEALASAIAEVVRDESTKAGGVIRNSFGGPTVITGEELNALVNSDFENAGALLAAASE